MPKDRPPPTDRAAADRGERAVLLALYEGALERGDHERAEELRRQLADLGVTVHVAVVRPHRHQKGGRA